MDYVYFALLIVALLIGWFINLFGLPGLWLMVLGHFGYGLMTGWDRFVGWQSTIALVALALVAEALEFVAGAAGSASAGGRKRGMVGAIIGGIVGGILGTPVVPIVGTLVGACAGAFAGAALMEFSGKDMSHSLRVGLGAAKGRFWGIVIKLSVGLIMLIISGVTAFPAAMK